MIQADRKTISSWTKDAFELNKRRFQAEQRRFQADQRTIFKQIKGRFQADQRRLQAEQKDDVKLNKRDNYKQMSKPWRAETEVICYQEL